MKAAPFKFSICQGCPNVIVDKAQASNNHRHIRSTLVPEPSQDNQSLSLLTPLACLVFGSYLLSSHATGYFKLCSTGTTTLRCRMCVANPARHTTELEGNSASLSA